MYRGSIPAEDVEKDALYLGLSTSDFKPESCKKYPYTNLPERLESLYSVLDAVSVCPVAFEIYERLKREYGFKFKGMERL